MINLLNNSMKTLKVFNVKEVISTNEGDVVPIKVIKNKLFPQKRMPVCRFIKELCFYLDIPVIRPYNTIHGLPCIPIKYKEYFEKLILSIYKEHSYSYDSLPTFGGYKTNPIVYGNHGVKFDELVYGIIPFPAD
jgi:hypothetical protein